MVNTLFSNPRWLNFALEPSSSIFVSFYNLNRKIMGTQELIHYEPLGKEFLGRGSQRGWVFREVKREGDIAMYEKVSEDGDMYWEVIRVRRRDGGVGVIGGREFEFKAKELYPSDNSFGVDGWCYGLLVDADDRFRSLVLEPSDSVI